MGPVSDSSLVPDAVAVHMAVIKSISCQPDWMVNVEKYPDLISSKCPTGKPFFVGAMKIRCVVGNIKLKYLCTRV